MAESYRSNPFDPESDNSNSYTILNSLINFSNDKSQKRQSFENEDFSINESQQCQSFTYEDFSHDESQQFQSFTNENSSDTWHFRSLCNLKFGSSHTDSAQSSKSSSEQVSRANYSDDLDYLKELAKKQSSVSLALDESSQHHINNSFMDHSSQTLHKNLSTQTTTPGKVDLTLPITCDRQSLETSTLDDFYYNPDDNFPMNSEMTDNFDRSPITITQAESADEPNTESACDSSQGDASNSKKMRTRKRKRNPEDWKRSVSKRVVNTGEAGHSSDDHPIKKKTMGPNCGNCRFKCVKKVSNANRQTLFNEFWNLGDRERQWAYLDRLMEIDQSGKKECNSNKSISRQYFLIVSGERVKVCRTMFLNTFDVSTSALKTIEVKKNDSEARQIIGKDLRGKHSKKGQKTPDTVLQSIRNHINMFPRKESHYCRSSTTREYLNEDLNINKMYQLYKIWMISSNEEANIASEYRYRYVFNNEFNLFFHHPKKDQCDDCAAYYALSQNERQELSIKQQHDLHLTNKNTVRETIKIDIKEAQENLNILCASFDLQKVLNTPRAEICSFYYKRKLAIYNFTVYDFESREVQCFLWNETTAKRGANEISSCLWKYIVTKNEKGKTDFRFCSDNCGGQNRNQILFSTYAYAANTLGVAITHRYLVKGHTQTAGDSVHSTIETASAKRLPIYSQSEWSAIIREAKSEEPKYNVYEISQQEIFNFATLSIKNFWKKIHISTLSEVEFTPGGKFRYIYDYDKQSHHTIVKLNDKETPLTRCYGSKLSIDKEKANDLRMLMNKNLIPANYHQFYLSLLD